MFNSSKPQIEQGDFPRAGLLRRLASLLYDMFLVTAIWFVLGYLIQFFFGAENNQIINGQIETDPFIDALYFFLMVSSCICFYGWFWMRSGQTLGMLALRLRVVSLTGNPLTLSQILVRWCSAWPSFFVFGLGYFWIFLDRKGDAFHDKLSKSKVIVIPKSQRPF